VSAPRGLTVETPAKLNLGLRVLGRRPDGYHEIETIMQTVSIYDRLTFEEIPGSSEIVLVVDDPALAEEDNLVIQAARLLRERAGLDRGIWIKLEKTIPTAAGLGGASSDAAATLLALDRLWRIGFAEWTLADLALMLGSDVPFFLRGGTARATGRGERLEPLPPVIGRWFVVVVPRLLFPVPHKTATLYRALDTWDHYRSQEVRLDLADIDATWNPFGRMSYSPFNTFSSPLHRMRPELRYVLAAFEAAGARSVALSGAGPAHYTVTRDAATAERLAELIGRRLAGQAEVFACEPVAGPPRIQET
jgi:4-diphosphocytidyl-2-C-methyl-D-erythritol kinase